MALASDQHRVIWNSTGALVACIVTLTGAYFIIPALAHLPVDMADRLAFALRADLFVVVWVLLGTRLEAMARFYQTPAPATSKKPLAPKQAETTFPKSFLQNTLEQAFIAVMAHLVLATLLHGSALALIPGAVVLFCAGRVAFLADRSKGQEMRSFGMVLTALPTFAGFALAIALLMAQIAAG
ncbi:MAG: MAPEG family protein [Hyphomonadaceae bacterium]|nr:MAPEG family protein [Hyphomonadaceae bacterium]